jgi:mannose-6-phosphate isomerase-like protein (cupin superfamily)
MDLMVSHPGQEYCYVLSGRIRFHVGAEIFELAAGEGILLNSELPHRADNIGDDEARILMVVAKSSHSKSSEHFDWWRVAGAAAPTTSSTRKTTKTKTSQGE